MIGIKKMNKILLLIFMFVSSPLYSDEFTFHCDNDDGTFSIIFDVNPIQKSVVLSHSIDKEKNTVFKADEVMEVYYWDEENDSVWLLDYEIDTPDLHTLEVLLLNFKNQKFKIQALTNVIPADEQEFHEEFWSNSYHCYTLK